MKKTKKQSTKKELDILRDRLIASMGLRTLSHDNSLTRLRIAVWVLTIGLAITMISLSLLLYGNPSLL